MRIGVDLGGTKIEGVVLDDSGKVVRRERVATPRGDYGQTILAIAELVRRLEDGASASVGVGTPGVLHPGREVMKNCNSTWLNGMPLARDLGDALSRPVRLANDANCFALAEAHAGAGKTHAVVFGIILGTGVGGGLVFSGQVHDGASGLAGEWGHTPLPYLRTDSLAPSELAPVEARLTDRDCYCGRRNCIETFLSGPSLSAMHRQLAAEEASAEEIVGAAEGSKALTWNLYCVLLARSLAQIVNVIDPDVIVVGGGLSKAQDLYAKVNEILPRYVFSNECAAQVVPPVGGDAFGAVGAAWLWQ